MREASGQAQFKAVTLQLKVFNITMHEQIQIYYFTNHENQASRFGPNNCLLLGHRGREYWDAARTRLSSWLLWQLSSIPSSKQELLCTVPPSTKMARINSRASACSGKMNRKYYSFMLWQLLRWNLILYLCVWRETKITHHIFRVQRPKNVLEFE